jgi:hypothetical protein
MHGRLPLGVTGQMPGDVRLGAADLGDQVGDLPFPGMPGEQEAEAGGDRPARRSST